jgi:hypothetical protein
VRFGRSCLEKAARLLSPVTRERAPTLRVVTPGDTRQETIEILGVDSRKAMGAMQPYVVRAGDYLRRIAFNLGFDADEVWNDPANADLRSLRPNPDILLPGDLLYVPDDGPPPKPHDLVTGSTNTFQAPDPPMTSFSVQFVGGPESKPVAGKAYVIQEMSDQSGLSTDGEGIAKFKVPVTMDSITVVFADPDVGTYVIAIGGMDPIDTLAGANKRLQNLGFVDRGAVESVAEAEEVRAGCAASNVAANPGAGGGGQAAAPDPTAASDPVGDDGRKSLMQLHGY